MPHSGIYQYGGDESGNVALGQLGFKVLTASGNTTDDGTFAALKVIGGLSTAKAAVQVTVHQGEGFTCTILTGEIIWGPFKNVTLSGTPGTSVIVLAYYG
jgi:hypothetical protein